MNLWVKGKGLLALLLLVALCSSCEEEINEIGLPVENNLNLQYLEYTVPTEMVWVDSVISRNTSSIFVGKFDFEEAGMVTSEAYVPLAPQVYFPNINIPASATFKEFYITVDYTSAITANEPSENSLSVYELADTINRFEESYIENKVPLGNLLGEKTFTFYPDSLKLDQQTDTINYFERIDLDQSKGLALFDALNNADSSNFANYELFSQFLKGMALVPGENNTAIFGLEPSTTQFVISYEFDDEGVTKTGFFSFLPTTAFFQNISPNKDMPINGESVFTGLECCYTDFDPSGDFVYQLFGSGINIKLDFSAFRNFEDSLEVGIINAALLELGGVETTVDLLSPPNGLVLFYVDESNTRIVEEVPNLPGLDFFQTLPTEREINQLYDPERLGDPAVVAYNRTDKKYTVNIARYLESVTQSDSIPAQLLLESANIQNVGNLIRVRRAVGNIGAIRIPKDAIKVKLYYSTRN